MGCKTFRCNQYFENSCRAVLSRLVLVGNSNSNCEGWYFCHPVYILYKYTCGCMGRLAFIPRFRMPCILRVKLATALAKIPPFYTPVAHSFAERVAVLPGTQPNPVRPCYTYLPAVAVAVAVARATSVAIHSRIYPFQQTRSVLEVVVKQRRVGG